MKLGEVKELRTKSADELRENELVKRYYLGA